MEIKERLNISLVENSNDADEKVHPWRRCGRGKHLVREHTVHVSPSKKHPSGKDAIWHEHCANNPSGKDELSYAEIKYISKTYFSSLIGPPTADVLTQIFADADKYDVEIRGWVQYWNDIFQLDNPLDPNLVKALIATESSFILKPKEHKYVYGLMQITGRAHQYLGGANKELRDHFFSVSTDELIDASCNIAAGVRWLFRKKQTASALLDREATWEETIEDYKAILEKRIHGKPYNLKPMEDFRKYYKILSGR
jgi:hypothetical protein